MRSTYAPLLLSLAWFQHCTSSVAAAAAATQEIPSPVDTHRNDSYRVDDHRFRRRLAEHIKHHPRCSLNEDTENIFVLEKHHGKGTHGDVCRDPISGDFHCPSGCRASHAAPYCHEKVTQVLELASPIGGPAAHRPCRVDASEAGDKVSSSSALSLSSSSSVASETGSTSSSNGQQSIFETSSTSLESTLPRSSGSGVGSGGSASRSSILDRLGSKGLGSTNRGVVVKVGNLPADITSTDLKELFSTVGDVLSAQLEPSSTSTANSNVAGRASVVFATREGAAEAVAQFHTRTLDGLPMEVSLANNGGGGGSSADLSLSSSSSRDSSGGAGETVLSNGVPSGATAPGSLSQAKAEKSKIPIFASPVMMFNKQGEKYADGEAPSKPGLFFPSLNSARWVDPLVDIYLITNFLPHASDKSELDALSVTLLDADECLSHPNVKHMYEAFSKPCPIGGGGALGGSGIIGVTRFFALQGAMELMKLNMVFFLEGDNLLLRPVAFLAQAYKLEEYKIDATITHISFHASFFSLDFLSMLNKQAKLFAEFTDKFLTGTCFLTGGGQDMRLGYEGARMLQVHRHLHPQDGKKDARILNTAGGTVPCRLVPRRWINSLGLYCNRSQDTAGPCALEQPLRYFNENNGHMWTSQQDVYLPQLYECDPRSVMEAAESTIPGSLQQNLKGSSVKQSPSDCTSVSRDMCEGSPTDHVKVSQTFYCDEDWVKANPTEQNNKALSFRQGRAYSMVAGGSWVEHFNLHFQGGGCKAQMATVFAAVQRSANESPLSHNGFTCEKAAALADHEECMRSGTGATGSMHGSPPS